MNRVFVLLVIGLVAGGLGCLGEQIEVNLLRFYLPGVLHGLVAAWAAWRFFVQRQGFAIFLIWAGWFVWYYFQLMGPITGPFVIDMIDSYGKGARLWGALAGGLTPAVLYASVCWWRSLSFFKRLEAKYGVHLEPNSLRLGLLVANRWGVAVFLAVAVVYTLSGGFIMGSLHLMTQMRNTESGTGFEQIGGAAGSVVALAGCAPSLLFVIVMLWRGPWRIFWAVVAPVCLIWTLGLVLSGTRTYIVAIAGALLVVGCLRFRFNTARLGALGLALLFMLALAQTTFLYRNYGLRNFNLGEAAANVFAVQGLETLADQTRSFYYYSEPGSVRWFDVDPISGFFIGLVHRPAEYSWYLIPRTLWKGKPLDPTFTEFTRFGLILSGWGDLPFVESDDGKDTGFGTSHTTGFLGRDVMRYGPLGAFSLIFWFGLFLAIGDACFDAAVRNYFAGWIAAAIAGTCFAMWRGPEPPWMLLLMPSALVAAAGMLTAARWQRRLIARSRNV